jgi:hypothetical protein
MYVKYNTVLRGLDDHTICCFSATIYLICSALRKLSRFSEPPPGLILFRGNGGMALPIDFLEPDEQGFAGGVECAFMSATPERRCTFFQTAPL